MLVPRVSLLSPTDAVTIPSPANSLLVYNTNVNKAQMPDGEGFYYWDIIFLLSGIRRPLHFPATKVSAITAFPCAVLNNVTGAWQKITDMGTFVKSNSNTFIELTLQANLYISTYDGFHCVTLNQPKAQ